MFRVHATNLDWKFYVCWRPSLRSSRSCQLLSKIERNLNRDGQVVRHLSVGWRRFRLTFFCNSGNTSAVR
jgi:hypothetical protein